MRFAIKLGILVALNVLVLTPAVSAQTPVHVFSTNLPGKVVRTGRVGALEGTRARITVSAIVLEDSARPGHSTRAIRIDFAHTTATPICHVLCSTEEGRDFCQKADPVLYVEETKLATLRQALPTKANRAAEYVDFKGCGFISNSTSGLIMCAFTVLGTADDLDALLVRAAKILDSSF